jgi:hypothetical protein
MAALFSLYRGAADRAYPENVQFREARSQSKGLKSD